MLKPEADNEIPETTARVARAAFPKGNRIMKLRDAFGTVYQDEDFKALFSSTGQPALAPWRLALVTVFQFLEGLSDREAADAVRSRIDWKYALGLELDDAGFNFSVLSEFRDRLIKEEAESALLDTLLKHFQEQGLLKAGGKQRSDATHILAQVRALNRSECIVESLRAALNVLATVDPDWLAARVDEGWFKRYALRVEETRLVKGKEARRKYLEQVGHDGFVLLESVYAARARGYLADLPALETLRKVWLHHFWLDEGEVRYRDANDLAPAKHRLSSPYDPEAAFGKKGTYTWTGYKVFFTETCDATTPRLITHVSTTSAGTSDVGQTDKIHEALETKHLLPEVHLADGGFVDADLLLSSTADYGVELLGPVRRDRGWQAKTPGAYDISRFTIDWDGQTMTCPEGKQSSSWTPKQDSAGNTKIAVKFRYADCTYCQARHLCTRSKKEPKGFSLKSQEAHRALSEARMQQQQPAWRERYKARSGIESTMSQGVGAHELRRSRYRGQEKTALQHVATAAAINVQRVTDWLAGVPIAKTRVSSFARLQV